MFKPMKDDIVLVFNSTLGGQIIYEGKALVEKVLEDGRCEVRFVQEPDATYERFVVQNNFARLHPIMKKAYEEAKQNA